MVGDFKRGKQRETLKLSKKEEKKANKNQHCTDKNSALTKTLQGRYAKQFPTKVTEDQDCSLTEAKMV